MSALSVGMLGFVLSLMGMECTFIGGKEHSKHKKIYAGGWCHIISGEYKTVRRHRTDLNPHSGLELGQLAACSVILQN